LFADRRQFCGTRTAARRGAAFDCRIQEADPEVVEPAIEDVLHEAVVPSREAVAGG